MLQPTHVASVPTILTAKADKADTSCCAIVALCLAGACQMPLLLLLLTWYSPKCQAQCGEEH
jgi:hypothetical protein